MAKLRSSIEELDRLLELIEENLDSLPFDKDMTLPTIVGKQKWESAFIAVARNRVGIAFKKLAQSGRCDFEYVGDSPTHSALYRRKPKMK